MNEVRVIAYYLPQFHPIPENNEWWGAGFTEWTNVAAAKPLFRGHDQPKLPGDLGFYDLRLPEIREAQAQLASNAGIEGFCYWHYWFGNGRRILERPFDEVLASGKPDFPFCLAWANESWTGIWHGNPKTVLLEQTYPGTEDEEAHFSLVLKAFRDNRYMKVDGKPVFCIYTPGKIPDLATFVTHWRQLAERAGLPGLHLVGMSNMLREGFLSTLDAVTTFAPGDYLLKRRTLARRALDRLGGVPALWPFASLLNGRLQSPARYDYKDAVATAFEDLPDDERHHPCVMPGWDNTPRSGRRGIVFENATPGLFRAYIRKAVSRLHNRKAEHRIIFLKAWNEWAEGNYLEPDRKHGHAFLDALRAEIKDS